MVDTERLPLFCFFAALIVTFLLTRINVRLIRAKIGWFRNLNVGEMHIHHVVFGVVLTLLGGVSGLIMSGISVGWYAVTAAVFGIGAALILDEFALILHLRDVYWEEEGRASVDAVFIAIAVTGLLLLGLRPLGWENSDGTLRGTWLTAGFIVANLVLAVITLAQGQDLDRPGGPVRPGPPDSRRGTAGPPGIALGPPGSSPPAPAVPSPARWPRPNAGKNAGAVR